MAFLRNTSSTVFWLRPPLAAGSLLMILLLYTALFWPPQLGIASSLMATTEPSRPTTALMTRRRCDLLGLFTVSCIYSCSSPLCRLWRQKPTDTSRFRGFLYSVATSSGIRRRPRSQRDLRDSGGLSKISDLFLDGWLRACRIPRTPINGGYSGFRPLYCLNDLALVDV